MSHALRRIDNGRAELRRTVDRVSKTLIHYLRPDARRAQTTHAAPDHSIELVRDGGRLDADEQNRVFGESVPKGLRIL